MAAKKNIASPIRPAPSKTLTNPTAWQTRPSRLRASAAFTPPEDWTFVRLDLVAHFVAPFIDVVSRDGEDRSERVAEVDFGQKQCGIALLDPVGLMLRGLSALSERTQHLRPIQNHHAIDEVCDKGLAAGGVYAASLDDQSRS